MSKSFRLTLALAGCVFVGHASAQITLFEHERFSGRTFSARGTVPHLARSGFNDRATSAIVDGNRWEVCDEAAFRGRCTVLRPGRYPSLATAGLNDRISSVRPVNSRSRVNTERYAPQPMPAYDDRRRQGEQLYQAQVRAVRAVYGPQEQRCWVERDRVQREPERGDASVPGGIVGALIGGIIGHQIGGGTGRDLATIGGVVAGAAFGANLARDSSGRQVATRDVQHCAIDAVHGQIAYWDVSYDFRGREHHMQAISPPGAYITVNRLGEPRS
jgi:uncharacterized protein YcfJ